MGRSPFLRDLLLLWMRRRKKARGNGDNNSADAYGCNHKQYGYETTGTDAYDNIGADTY